MSLLAKIKADQLQSRKNKTAVLTSLLTTLLGDASMAGKNDGNRESTDLEVVAVIKKFIKNSKEIMAVVTIENRARYYAAMDEIVVLTDYLPVQLDEVELERIVNLQIVALENAKPQHMGKIMAHLKQNFAGQYDGKLASKIVRDLLNA